jgi:hypothetical protein
VIGRRGDALFAHIGSAGAAVLALTGCGGGEGDSSKAPGGDDAQAEGGFDGAPADADTREDGNGPGVREAAADGHADAQAEAAADGQADAQAEAAADANAGRDAAASDGARDAEPLDSGPSDAGADGSVDPCSGGRTGVASDDDAGPQAQVQEYGTVGLFASSQNQVTRVQTTLAVPPEPPPTGTLFLWPGLQPLTSGANFAVLNNGVLQPVLTWGPTCAPAAPANAYASWWISAQYVNTNITKSSPNYAAYSGCHGGQGMAVGVGDELSISMVLSGTSWVQTVHDPSSGHDATFTIDMLGQAQNWAEFVIEEYSSAPVSEVVFTGTEVTFAESEPAACRPSYRGPDDYFSAPRSSQDGKTCCISRIILRAQGVAATSPNGP